MAHLLRSPLSVPLSHLMYLLEVIVIRTSVRAALAGLLVAMAMGATSAVQAMPYTFTAHLDGASENPPNLSPGSGSATIIIDLDSALSLVGTMRVMADFEDLIGTTTAAHIHCCTPPPNNAGVATQTPTFTRFPLGVTSGSYDATFDLALPSSFTALFISANGGTLEGAAAALLAGLQAGQAYFNIHTTFVPGGEIRGFLVPEQIALLSEPNALALLSLVALGTLMRGRRRP